MQVFYFLGLGPIYRLLSSCNSQARHNSLSRCKITPTHFTCYAAPASYFRSCLLGILWEVKVLTEKVTSTFFEHSSHFVMKSSFSVFSKQGFCFHHIWPKILFIDWGGCYLAATRAQWRALFRDLEQACIKTATQILPSLAILSFALLGKNFPQKFAETTNTNTNRI